MLKRTLMFVTAAALFVAGFAYADTAARSQTKVTADAGYVAPSGQLPAVRVDAKAKAVYSPARERYIAPKKGAPAARLHVSHRYELAYFAPGVDYRTGRPEWTEAYTNIVPDVALNQILDDTYKTKTPHANFYVGLITGPGASGCAAGDTMGSHAGWTEAVPYSNGTRVTWTPGTVSSKSVSNSGSPAVFNINGSATVGGTFLVSSSDTAGGTKSGTGGTIRSCGAFSSGDKTVSSGGTLTVTITATAS